MITKNRGNKKASGGRYIDARKKRAFEARGQPTLTKVAEKKVKEVRTIGGNKKSFLYSTDEANVYDPKTKKYSKVKIKIIVDNAANRNFVRRNILTKGAIIETEKGKARITSRPGQEPVVNAILI